MSGAFPSEGARTATHAGAPGRRAAMATFGFSHRGVGAHSPSGDAAQPVALPATAQRGSTIERCRLVVVEIGRPAAFRLARKGLDGRGEFISTVEARGAARPSDYAAAAHAR